MPIVVFENAFDGNATKQIAVNSDQVISVYESDVDIPEIVSNKKKNSPKKMRVTNIYTQAQVGFAVKNSFAEVIARLNGE
jgi:hypothetical protein